jgi:menaquinone-dependent protoporphyrinogen IX oxidase
MRGFLPPAKKFVKKNKEALAKIPVAYFSLGITMKEDTPQRRKRMMRKLKAVTKHIAPVDVGLFGGRYQGNDYRDWDKIQAWAKELTDKLRK